MHSMHSTCLRRKMLPGWSPFTAPDPGAVHSPQDLSETGSGVGVRVPMMSAFSKVSVVCCTWGTGNTGLMTASGYVWNTDYATTVKQTPLWTQELAYTDNSTTQITPDGVLYPAGEYLIVMSSSRAKSGIWYLSSTIRDGVQGFRNGSPATLAPRMTFDRVVDSETGAAYRRPVTEARLGATSLLWLL